MALLHQSAPDLDARVASSRVLAYCRLSMKASEVARPLEDFEATLTVLDEMIQCNLRIEVHPVIGYYPGFCKVKEYSTATQAAAHHISNLMPRSGPA